MPLIGPGTTAAPVGGSVVQIGFTTGNGIENLTDGNTGNYAEIANLLTAASDQGVSVADANTTYPSGFYAGYVVELGSNGLLSARALEGLQVQTYNNGAPAESRTFSTGLGVTLLSGGSPGKVYLSFKTAQPFDEVRLVRGTLANLTAANSLKIYYATAFDPACGTLDNNNICEDQIAGNQTVVNFNPGLLNALATLANPGNITDGDKKTFASLALPVGTGLLSSPPYVGVKSLQTIYPANGRVGFVIQQEASLLSTDVLSNLRIQTYLHGELREDVALNSSGTLVGVAALGGTDPVQKVSIPTTLSYNEVRLVVAQTASINVGVLRIYYAFESGSTCSDCQDLLASGGAYPGAAIVNDGNRTGGSSCLGLGSARVDDENLVVNGDYTDYGRIRPPFLGVGCEGSISVRTTGDAPYTIIPANAFAGFVVSKNGNLLDLGVLGGLRIRTYLDGNLRDDSNASGISLVGLSVLSNGTGLTKVGIKTTQSFDEIRITVDFGVLGTFATSDAVRVYYAFVQRDDDNDGVLDCNEVCKDPLNTGDDSVDSDGDGIPDDCETCNAVNNKSATIDTDGDGLFNNCDIDSDNDGIPDTIEDTNNDGDPNNDDQDGDGIPNYLDLDSDNDGILDLYESGLTPAQISANDPDGNGVLNGQNPVAVATPRDTDGDGVPDYLDLDSDNDGIKDLIESGYTGLTDVNNDGVVDGPDADNDGIQDSADGNDGTFGTDNLTAPKNTDGDNAPDYRDLDSDNDGIKDLTESGRPDLGTLDANNDGVLDGADADGDGIRDNVDTADDTFGSPEVITFADTDSDSVPNYLDLDSDNDGIKDLYESGLTGFTDADNNGVVDNGTDSDNDGIQDSVDTATGAFGSPGAALKDSDSDTVPNYLDLDSDNDGIKDLYESGIPNPGSFDSDKNGVIDVVADTDNDGIQDSVDEQDNAFGSDDLAAPIDTDGDGAPDANDLDSDNDSINDIIENGDPAIIDGNNNGMVEGTDADGDGILGTADTNDGVFGSVNNVPTPVNSDNDPLPNFQDLDSDNDSVSDLVEGGDPNATDSPEDGVVDGPDSDGDGIQDSVDGAPNTFGDANSPAPQDSDPVNNDGPDYIDTDSDGDGTNDIVENGNGNLDQANGGDGEIDDTTDADNDGIADVVDEKLNEFGGLSQTAGTPDLTPSIFSNGATYNGGDQKDVVVTIYNVGTAPTSGPVTFEINKITPSFTIAVDPNATSSNVTDHTAVANGEWTFNEEFARYLVTLNAGLSIPAGGSKEIVIQVSASTTPNAAATITARVFNGTGGGETPVNNNLTVYRIGINSSSNN
ncbi:hypothetical protein GCM10007390_30180 [Persicitalea jodogahamensis]|uniref:Uncharacterized protein n=2 Tax=Persicitalea jodogahamensis TaxID=402147 RepID=A0A8J3GAK2_9BACT|nr:hypothetical protein GCM10007390_30180 [Persicitalea jodogahamensis]